MNDELVNLEDLINSSDSINSLYKDELDLLKIELKDDKYLIVFKTTLDQSNNLILSLNKSLNSCQSFINFYNESRNFNKDEFITLYSSFKTKCLYYLPSCQRVLFTLNKSLNDRKSINGSCLVDYNNLKATFNELENKLDTVDKIMKSLQFKFVSSNSNTPSKLPRPSTPSFSRPLTPSSSYSRPTTPHSNQSRPSTPSRIPTSKRSSTSLSSQFSRLSIMTPEPTLRAHARPFWGASNDPIPRSNINVNRKVSSQSNLSSSSTVSTIPNSPFDQATYKPNPIDPLDVSHF